ncbi:DUF4476 domain-containing protein [Armatimonas sp.]|uniref:DUF4476 domain-containing protein n=1 Tax=Armatimonas sp. TaxID=1872638 RepID=UPI003752CE44
MQKSREIRTTGRAMLPEERAHRLAVDMADARELLRRVLAAQSKDSGTARERETRRDRENDQRRLETLLDQAERDARDLERDLVRQSAYAYLEVPRLALRDDEFRDVVDSVKRRSFPEDKLSTVRLATRSSYLTCSQLRVLVGLFNFSEGKEEVAVTLYPRLTDPQRFYTLADAFPFSSTWRSVCTKLGIL